MGIADKVETFACMAEARAHFYQEGYNTLYTTEDGSHYVLVKDISDDLFRPMVRLTKTDFLKVEVEYL